MALIKIVYRNGNQESFDDSRSTYGYNQLNSTSSLVMITDPYGKETIIPIDLIERIEHFKEKQY